MKYLVKIILKAFLILVITFVFPIFYLFTMIWHLELKPKTDFYTWGSDKPLADLMKEGYKDSNELIDFIII